MQPSAFPVERGFTLVELIAVMVILGVLGVVVASSCFDVRHDARIAKLRELAATMDANARAVRTASMLQNTEGGTTTFSGMSLSRRVSFAQSFTEQWRMGVRYFGVAMVATALLVATSTNAQTYPSKPIRFIVPFPPGGGADLNARTVAQKMSESLGQPVVIESRPGAGGNIGTEFVARAPADGYTILFGTNGHAVQPHLRKLTWDPIRDFAPVSLISTYPLVLAVHPSVPVKSVAELVTYAKAHPGKLTYGSSGAGAPLHLGAELFKSAVGVDIVHVPYKGNGPMTAAILAGEVSLVFDSMAGPLPHIRAGKLRALAVTSPKRTSQLPEIPTIDETVAPGYAYEAWNGVLAPAGTPREIVLRLSAEIAKAVALPDVRERLIGAGYDPISAKPEELAARLAADLERFGRVIREAGIKVD